MLHNQKVVEQFTKMAGAFASAPHIIDRQALDLLLGQSGACSQDQSLDVACGAGVVACHFATVVARACGIDITPAMIDRAKSLQTSSGLKNISWAIGDVTRLPYKDDSFTVVTSRYAFHHIEHPDLVLNEMQRVCTVGGMVVVADICVSEDETKAAHFNALERLHDPSHLRALPLSEHIALFESVGLAQPRVAHYKVDFTLSRLLRALGHRPEDARRAEIMVRESIAHDALGTQSRIVGDETIFSYPIAVMAARKTRDSKSAT